MYSTIPHTTTRRRLLLVLLPQRRRRCCNRGLLFAFPPQDFEIFHEFSKFLPFRSTSPLLFYAQRLGILPGGIPLPIHLRGRCGV